MGTMMVYKICIWAKFGRIASVMIAAILVFSGAVIMAKRDLMRYETEIRRIRAVESSHSNGHDVVVPRPIEALEPRRTVETKPEPRKCRIPFKTRR